MKVVEQIKQPIHQEMELFEEKFTQSMSSKVALLNRITHFIVNRKGKQMRPMFIFLTAKMLGNINDKTYDAATLVELLHTATLVHDDVVDDANERRGFFSVNALWKNKIAVLVGDYMLSKVLTLSIEKNNADLLEIVARTVKEMSEGELLQIEKARKMDITEEVYFNVIKKKTASLIATCCEGGALSVDRQDISEKMRLFGETIGIAFQIKDDIFDLGSEVAVGKPTGNDIREQKMTLPIIYALNTLDTSNARSLANIIKNKNHDASSIKQAIQMVNNSGGIAYAEKKMQQLGTEAKALLAAFPDQPAKRSLLGLVDYTMNRTK